MLKSLVLILLLTSCALKKATPEPTQKENEDTYSKGSVLNLAKTSYIRGCIDGMNKLLKKRTRGTRLKFCKMKAGIHILEIKSILNATPEKKKSSEAK